MWLFTTKGFFSVVIDTQTPGNLLVRARSQQEIERFIEVLSWETGGKVRLCARSTPQADYPWRVSVMRHHFHHVMGRLIDNLNYPNFKAAVSALRQVGPGVMTQPALHEVWELVRAHEPSEARSKRRKGKKT